MQPNRKNKKKIKAKQSHSQYDMGVRSFKGNKLLRTRRKSKQVSSKARSNSKESFDIGYMSKSKRLCSPIKVKTDRTRSCTNPGKLTAFRKESLTATQFTIKPRGSAANKDYENMLARCQQVLNCYQLKCEQLREENRKLQKMNEKLTTRRERTKSKDQYKSNW